MLGGWHKCRRTGNVIELACAQEAQLNRGAHAGDSEPMALAIEIDAAWLAKPDMIAKLMPSKRWKLSNVDMRPAMYVRVDFFEILGRLRLSFPMQSQLPIFSGMSICFMESPQVCHGMPLLSSLTERFPRVFGRAEAGRLSQRKTAEASHEHTCVLLFHMDRDPTTRMLSCHTRQRSGGIGRLSALWLCRAQCLLRRAQ
jgi:hypothetical protein